MIRSRQVPKLSLTSEFNWEVRSGTLRVGQNMGQNREISWKFNEVTDFAVKFLLSPFPIHSVGKFRPKSNFERRPIHRTK